LHLRQSQPPRHSNKQHLTPCVPAGVMSRRRRLNAGQKERKDALNSSGSPRNFRNIGLVANVAFALVLLLVWSILSVSNVSHRTPSSRSVDLGLWLSVAAPTIRERECHLTRWSYRVADPPPSLGRCSLLGDAGLLARPAAAGESSEEVCRRLELEGDAGRLHEDSSGRRGRRTAGLQRRLGLRPAQGRRLRRPRI